MDKVLIQQIIKDNPNKELVEFGCKQADRLSKVIDGEDFEKWFTQDKYFETDEVFNERKKSQSNKDLFARVFQKEEMVFNARGGTVLYDGLSPAQKDEFNSYISTIRNGQSVRHWVATFAKKAYEVDPSGIIFIEKDDKGKPYPTYKSIHVIYDYKPNGGSVDYVCFKLSQKEAKKYVQDSALFDVNTDSAYYRFVDEKSDMIFKKVADNVTFVEGTEITHGFTTCPAIMISDIPHFRNANKRLSKADTCVELAEQFMYDRSVRNTMKKYHGFPKLVQPLVICRKCQGSGYIGEVACPHCEGTGFTELKKVSDSIKIPLNSLETNSGLDIRRIFTYITPDIQTWDKQDNSLNDLENRIFDTYWGTDNRKFTTGASLQSDIKETATKTMTNLQPVYARLERTARWAENIEREIIYLIGSALFKNSLKSVMVQYGRDYILESTEDLFNQYLEYKAKGAPQFVLNDALERYFRSLYQTNPVELAMALKIMEVEPYVHYTLKECKDMQISDIESKEYFIEWYNGLKNEEIISLSVEQLKQNLSIFVKSKEKVEENPEPELT